MKLSKVERLMLVNQYLILEGLYPDEKEFYANNRKAIEEGFELHYSDLFAGISDETLTEEECREVLDILDMFRAITFSYEKLQDKTGIDEYRIKFHGFDLNDEYEGKRVIYSRYFINDLDRFEELKYGKGYADCNSHTLMIDVYRRMLNKWNWIQRKYKLSKDDILKIIE